MSDIQNSKISYLILIYNIQIFQPNTQFKLDFELNIELNCRNYRSLDSFARPYVIGEKVDSNMFTHNNVSWDRLSTRLFYIIVHNKPNYSKPGPQLVTLHFYYF